MKSIILHAHAIIFYGHALVSQKKFEITLNPEHFSSTFLITFANKTLNALFYIVKWFVYNVFIHTVCSFLIYFR